jgi:hypothetical protein
MNPAPLFILQDAYEESFAGQNPPQAYDKSFAPQNQAYAYEESFAPQNL